MINLCIFHSEEQRVLTWLTPGDAAHQVLTHHLHSKPFLSQVELAADGQHTGGLEVLHALFLAYASKRVDFNPPSYLGRIQLAIIDHNENCGRRVLSSRCLVDIMKIALRF